MVKPSYISDFDEGTSIKWKNDQYVIVHHEDDNVVVVCTMRGDVVVPDQYRREENFNPYAHVTPVLGA